MAFMLLTMEIHLQESVLIQLPDMTIRLAKKTSFLYQNTMRREPIFVPKSPDSDEGVGHIIALLFRKENRSDLMILMLRTYLQGL